MNPSDHPENRAPFQDLFEKIVSTSDMGALFNALPMIILILDRNRKAVFVNDRLTEFLGLDASAKKDLIGLAPGNIFRCHHAESGQDCGATAFCQYCGASNAILCCLQGRSDCQECRMLRRGEFEIEALDLLVWTHPFEMNDEAYVFFSVADISDVKRRRALERIFYHDVLNIAGALEGLIGMSAEGAMAPTPDEWKMMHDCALFVVEEIKAQRDLSSAENNTLRLTYAEINSIDFLFEIVRRYKNHKAARDRFIQVDPASAGVAFFSAPVILGRVLGNLIKNGLEAMEPGEALVVACDATENEIEFRVRNDQRIPEEIHLQIFKRSFSTKGEDRGLGLYSVKLLTERYLKGKATCKTAPEEGTVFSVRFPRDIRPGAV